MFKKPQYRPQFHGPRPAFQPDERIRTPRRHEGEIFAQITSLSGGSRMIVQCEDGKERMARIPGRVRKKIWIKIGDYAVVKPWPVETDTKCDLEYRYTKVQSDNLRDKGILKM